MIKKINLKSEFLKHVAVLMSGTVIAQILGYVFAPIITHLYTPEQTAELGLFLRISALGAAIATARYEYALPIAKSDVHAFRLFRFAFRLALIIGALCSWVIVFPLILDDFTQNRLLFYGLLPVYILLLAFFGLGNNWSIRLKLFNKMSYSRVMRSIGTNILKVGFGLIPLGYIGLIFATVIGQALANVWFWIDYIRNKKIYPVKARDKVTKVLAKQNSDFPKINLPHIFMETGRDILIAVVILEFFGKTEFGLYDHSFRMLRLPLVFAGVAIGQVFFQKCAELVNEGKDITKLLLKALRTLLLLSIVPIFRYFLLW